MTLLATLRAHLAVAICAALLAIAPVSVLAQTLVDLNTATQEELESLHGIGPVKAQAIINYRETSGLFASPEQLISVQGIGPRTYERLCHQIGVDGQPGCPSEVPPALSISDSVPLPSRSGDGRININLASPAELQTLPRIGPALAQRILDYRAAHGFFTDAEQLTDVSGIGDATYNQLEALVTTRANINTVNPDVLMFLGVPDHVAESIVLYRQDNGPYDSLHALLDAPGVDRELANALHDLLFVGPAAE